MNSKISQSGKPVRHTGACRYPVKKQLLTGFPSLGPLMPHPCGTTRIVATQLPE